MAKPKVRYVNTVRSSIGENNGLDFFKVYIRDKIIPADINLPFKSAGGFEINYPTNDSEPNAVFFGSNCTIPFLVEGTQGQGFIDSLIADQESRYFIEITKTDGVIPVLEKPFWRGVIVTDEIEHENREFPYIVNITAIDGISQLKERDILDTALVGTDSTVLEKIQGILKQMQPSLLFNDTDEFMATCMRWFESDMVSGDIDPLANLYYASEQIEYTVSDDGVIEYRKSFDVLETILKTLYCRIIQVNGSYFISQINEYKNQNLTVFKYAFNYSRTAVDPNLNPIGVISANQDIAVSIELDNNRPISSGVLNQESGALFRYFGAAKRAFVNYEIEFNDAAATVVNGGLNDTGILVISDQSLGLQIDLDEVIWFEDSGLSGTERYVVDAILETTIVIRDGTNTNYYLTPGGTWTLVPTVHRANYSATNNMGFNFTDGRNGYFMKTDDSFLVQTPPPTVSGTLYLGFEAIPILGTFIPGGGLSPSYTPNPVFVSRNIDVSFSYVDLNSGSLPKSINYVATNPDAPESSIEIDLGDIILSDRTGSGNFWQCFQFWDGTDWNGYTNGWQIDKTGDILPVSELYVSEVLSVRREPTARLDVVLLGDYNPLFSVLYDSDNFAFFGGTFNSKIGAWSVTLVQMTYNNTGVIITSTGDTGTPPTLKTGGNNLNQDINNRVRWRGVYEPISGGYPTSYQQNDLITSDGWMAIAATETTSLPIEEGVPSASWDILSTPALYSDWDVVGTGALTTTYSQLLLSGATLIDQTGLLFDAVNSRITGMPTGSVGIASISFSVNSTGGGTHWVEMQLRGFDEGGTELFAKRSMTRQFIKNIANDYLNENLEFYFGAGVSYFEIWAKADSEKTYTNPDITIIKF